MSIPQVSTRGHEPDQALQPHPLKSYRQRECRKNCSGDFCECNEADHNRLLALLGRAAGSRTLRFAYKAWARPFVVGLKAWALT
jgi:hypothetical protein